MRRQKTRKIIQLVSLLLFPVTLNYFSPYLVIQGSFEGVLSGSGVLFLSQFLTALFFGRAFCGWLCPAGGLQHVCSGIVNKPPAKWQRWIKYIIWVPWLGAILAGFITAGGLKRMDVLYYTESGISVSAPGSYIVYFFVVGLIVLLSLTLGRRAFCHTACWMAPFMIIGTTMKEKLRLPALRLQADPDKCIRCGACDRQCPMSLSVSAMVSTGTMFHSDCVLCAGCADCCPKGVIRLRLAVKSAHDLN